MYDPRKDEDVTFDKGELLKFVWKKFQGPIIIFIAALFILIYGVSLLFGGNDNSVDNSADQQLHAQEEENQNIPKKTTSKSSSPAESKPTCDLGCVDTDSGINTNSVGHTYFGTNTTCVVKYDRCINYAQLEEFYCEEGMMQSKIVKCKNGCNLGECSPVGYN